MLARVKITEVIPLIDSGTFGSTFEFKRTQAEILDAVRRVVWPVGAHSFTIFPESGKKSGKGNGVGPIKDGFMMALEKTGWKREHRAKSALGASLGDFDAAKMLKSGAAVVEWETGNISSSHRSLNKMVMLLLSGTIVFGTLVVPTRALYRFLTDRIGNIDELRPYIEFWRAVGAACPTCTTLRVKNGVLKIVVIEHEATSDKVPRIPKLTSGRARV